MLSPSAGMDHQTGGLVDDDNRIVFVKDPKRYRLRTKTRTLVGPGTDDHLAGVHTLGSPGRSSVHGDTGFDQGDRAGSTQREQFGQGLVDTLSIERAGDLEL